MKAIVNDDKCCLCVLVFMLRNCQSLKIAKDDEIRVKNLSRMIKFTPQNCAAESVFPHYLNNYIKNSTLIYL